MLLQTMRILYIEDEEDTRKLMQELLDGEVAQCMTAANAHEALVYLKLHPVDLILCDIEMPDMDGLEFSKISKSRYPNIPIIILSAYETIDYLKKGIDAGIDCYMTKPINEYTTLLSHFEELHIKYQQLKNKDNTIDNLIKRNDTLNTQAQEDCLTGLYNRRGIEAYLERSVSHSDKQENKLSIAIVDIDDFKHVNDTYGHLFGDRVLVALSSILKENVRDLDVVGRWGGEEFIIIMNDGDKEKATLVLERIRAKMLHNMDIEGIKVTASFGVFTLDSHQFKSLKETVQKADEALYYAKFNGKDKIVHFDSLASLSEEKL